MPETSTSQTGQELLAWEIREMHLHQRGWFWYTSAIALGSTLLIWATLTRNFLFAFIIIMFAVIIITHHFRQPIHYRLVLHELGVKIGERFHPWKTVQQFWIIYEPPEVKTLYLDFAGVRPRLPIPLEDTDPNEVRRILVGRLAEDTTKTEEPLSDWLIRVLKI